MTIGYGAKPSGPAIAVAGVLDRSFTPWLASTETEVTPSSGTYTLRNEAGTAIVDGETATVNGNALEYSDGALATLVAGSVYRETWSYVVSGTTYTFSQELYVVASPFGALVRTSDLTDMLPILANYPSGETSWGKVIASTHDRLVAALLSVGGLRRVTMWTPTLWRNWSLYASAGAALRAYGTLTGGTVLEQARYWEAKADREFERVLGGLEVDTDNDGDLDADAIPVRGAGGPSGGRTR